MTTAVLIKIVLPLSLLAAFAALYAVFDARPSQPHFNARQAAAIDSLRTVNTQKDLK